MRTSLSRAQSGYTLDEIQARADAMCREKWTEQGMLAISVNDPRLSWEQREMIRMIARHLGYGEH
jgi:menaquinone-dependent protoporphyrinogen IX oxidase